MSWRRYEARRSVYLPWSGPPTPSRRRRGWLARVPVGCGVLSSRRWRDDFEHTPRRWGETPDVANLATALAGKLQVAGLGRVGRFEGIYWLWIERRATRPRMRDDGRSRSY